MPRRPRRLPAPSLAHGFGKGFDPPLGLRRVGAGLVGAYAMHQRDENEETAEEDDEEEVDVAEGENVGLALQVLVEHGPRR